MAVGDKVYIADKPTQDDIKTKADSIDNKIGINTDASGTTTLFARLKQIYDYLTSYMSSSRMSKLDNVDITMSSRASQTSVNTIDTNVDTINTKVGTNTNGAGTTTVFARLKQIYDYLAAYMSSTRMAKIDKLDTNIASRASQTSVNTIDSVVDSILSKVNAMPSLIQPKKPVIGDLWLDNDSVIADTYYEVLSITSGSGIITRVKMSNGWSGTGFAKIRVTVDGVATVMTYGALTVDTRTDGASGELELMLQVHFNTSAKIEIGSSNVPGSGALQGSVDCSLV